MRMTDEMDLALMKAFRAAGGWVPGEPSKALARIKAVEPRPEGGGYRITARGLRVARERAAKKWGVRL